MTREEKEKIIAECEHMSFDFELFGRPTKALCLDAVKNILNDISESEYISNDNSETESEIEPTTNNSIDYRRAFKIACDLLNGDVLYGVDSDRIYEIMMRRDGEVANYSYEEYILNHLQELDHGLYAVDCNTCKNQLHRGNGNTYCTDINGCHFEYCSFGESEDKE